MLLVKIVGGSFIYPEHNKEKNKKKIKPSAERERNVEDDSCSQTPQIIIFLQLDFYLQLLEPRQSTQLIW